MDTNVDGMIALAAAASALLGVAGTQLYSRFRNRREERSADDQASDRLIALITQEADKRVQIVRAEFDLKLAQRDVEHAKELNSVRADFERQIATVRENAERYRCDIAPSCGRRRTQAEIKAGGTD